MSARTRKRAIDHAAADPWWGEPEPTVAAAPGVEVPVRGRRRVRRARSGLGWTLLGLAVAPLLLLTRFVARTPRLRRAFLRLVLVAVVLLFLAGSVGVILINNVVIGRTAELGKLDSQRRELRRDNAILGAESAKLLQPNVVFSRAAKDLGMKRSPTLPQFVYIDPSSHQLTQYQRNLRAARRARAVQGTAATAAPATTAPATKEQ
jgi:hypothetical protein